MPLVHINIVKGRPAETIEQMIAAVSGAIAESLGAPIESVRIMVCEMEPHQYGVGGKAWPTVEAEREQARRQLAEGERDKPSQATAPTNPAETG